MVFLNSINPILATIYSFEIRYYSFAYILGAIFTYFIFARLAEERKLGLTKQDIMDFVAYTLLSVIIFFKGFYVIIYNFGFFISNPLEVFAVWHGGLSFHGGFFWRNSCRHLAFKEKENQLLEACRHGCDSCCNSIVFGKSWQFYQRGIVRQDNICSLGSEI